MTAARPKLDIDTTRDRLMALGCTCTRLSSWTRC